MHTSFHAIEVKQNEWKFYVFSIKSDLLYKISYVSRRHKDKQKGYQRNLSEKRAKEIHNYILNLKGVIPNNIILNFDIDLDWDSDSQTISFDAQDDVAWIVDGQHRLFGLSFCEEPIDIVVVAFEKLDISNQAKIFRVINSTQKGVNASLIYDLIDLDKDATYLDERSHELVKKLNSDPDSPWHDQIKMLGIGKGLVSQSAFINNLKPLLDEEKRAPLIIYSEEEQYGILKNYFSAVKFLLPDDWGSAKSLLTKSVGFYAMMAMLPVVLGACVKKHNNFKVASVVKILEPIKNYDFSSHGPLKGVSGKAGVDMVTSEITSLFVKAQKNTKEAGIEL